ncbi:MAG: hypothetical protein NZ811_02805 [Gammaproteobacteria bacterium]|nr:hypothetical protein [Gammaproteobacteria bacterium]
MKEVQSLVSNMWTKQITLEHEGDAYKGHSHTFDHQHLLAVGKVRIRVDDGSGDEIVAEYEAPCIIFIEKDSIHSIECLSENSVGYCVHPIREGYRVEDIMSPDDNPRQKWKATMTYTKEDANGSKFRTSESVDWDNKDAAI